MEEFDWENAKLKPESYNEDGHFRLCNNWKDIIPDLFCNKKINYLEIGVFKGMNLYSVSQVYGKHQESLLVCIDPWCDYNDYHEYINQQNEHYLEFLKHTKDIPKNKINILRGFSHEKIPMLNNNYFDIIYIDGNHNPEYVMEDAVLSFRKLKISGYMIFDDYGWGGKEVTQKGIDGFLMGYYNRIKILGQRNSQVFIQKIS
jgi:hypothetical protein